MIFKLVYVSPNGTTKSTTVLLKNLIERDYSVELIDIGSVEYRNNFSCVLEALKDADIVGFGSPAYHMDMLEPMKKLINELSLSKSKFKFKAFFYLNYGGITSGKAFLNASKKIRKKGIKIIGAMKVLSPHFHHKEKFPIDDTKKFIEEFYIGMQEKEFEAIEWRRIKEIFTPEKIIVNILYPLAHFVGKTGGLPITIEQDRCKKCMKCERECPVGAISMDSISGFSPHKCIHCYHCTVACPLGCIHSPIEKLDNMIETNKKIVGTEQPVNKFFI